MAPSSWKVISGKLFELARMLRIGNTIPAENLMHSVSEVKNTTIDVHFGYGGQRQ